jgi:phosphatidylserine/phosphatidylglycerophosphate/cardiolipin synthase-like enzyme
MASVAAPPSPPAADEFGVAPLSAQLAAGRLELVGVSTASVHADRPDKRHAIARADPGLETVAQRFNTRLGEATGEVVLFSPYFIPSPELTERLRALRAQGVSVRVVTNSLAQSDEPFASVGLERHQHELLAMGVELYELSSDRIKLDTGLRSLLGSTIGRLHAKMAFVDRRIVYVGSLNLDARSAHINTEIGVRIESATIAAMLYRAYRVEDASGVYRVRLEPDGHGLEWSVLDDEGREQVLPSEPDSSWWRRVRLQLLSLLVPEGEL